MEAVQMLDVNSSNNMRMSRPMLKMLQRLSS